MKTIAIILVVSFVSIHELIGAKPQFRRGSDNIGSGSSVFGELFRSVTGGKCIGQSTRLVTFFYYSRHSVNDAQVLVTGDLEKLKKSRFNSAIPTKMIVHGFMDSMKINKWMIDMKNELLKEGNYNVIILDWRCANGPSYFEAVENSNTIGGEVADLVHFLKDTTRADPTSFHLIGHSLGCHLSAFAGQKIGNVGRITALDPAGPLFDGTLKHRRLDHSDAFFVDVIHTDSGSGAGYDSLGMHEQVGHIDFYPNGGRSQPGCSSFPEQIFQGARIKRDIRPFFTCNHMRAIDFFIESIGNRNCEYVGIICRDWNSFVKGQCQECSNSRCRTMGFHCEANHLRNHNISTDKYFLRTAGNKPFCLHQYQVIIEMEHSLSGQIHTSLFPTAIIVYLQLNMRDGTSANITLDYPKQNIPEVSNTATYLATTPVPLDETKGAKLWWKDKPSQSKTVTYMIQFKKIKVLPIAAAAQVERHSFLKKKELCGPHEMILAENNPVLLTVDKC